MNELRVHFHGLDTAEPVLLGRLGYGLGHAHTHFEWNPDFRRLSLNPSPVRLRLQPGLQAAPPEPFEGLHGLFADSLPDGWGRLLMDRTFRQRGCNLDEITPLHRLALAGSRAVKATLTF